MTNQSRRDKETQEKQMGHADSLALDDDALLKQCHVDHYRVGGPGGQKRNKTSSAIRLRHRPSGLSVTASDDRSQRVNKIHAIRRLREAIALHVRKDIDTVSFAPSDPLAACLAGSTGIKISSRNENYFPVVAEVLDILAAFQLRVSDAAAFLGISTAHLVKFIQSDPKTWERVNQMRTERGLKPLR